MRILSEVFKENGARAAGGLVRSGGRSALAWTLELKGDENFPGAAGRQRLKEQQKKLDGLAEEEPGKLPTASSARPRRRWTSCRRGAVR